MTSLDSTGPVGFRSCVANIGVKDSTADYCVVTTDSPCSVSGVFTQSRFAGPSVKLSRQAVASGRAQALVVVSKNANVANGPDGDGDAQALVELAAAQAGCGPDDVVVASTGVIGRRYPMEKMSAAIRSLGAVDAPADFEAVAQAIMTTDTHPKLALGRVGDAQIVGVAKGVGMIEPNMATLLTFFFTDADIAPPELDSVFRRVVDTTFNALSIDTDTSTSDSAVIFGNGRSGAVDMGEFEAELHRVALELVLMIAADGEGASRTIIATVRGARDIGQARLVSKSIVNSPLVKTAVHGADPNWGRVAMAIGKCEDQSDIRAEDVQIAMCGVGLYPGTQSEEQLADVARRMRGDRVEIEVDLNIGTGEFTSYGCDLTDGYVRINADYTT